MALAFSGMSSGIEHLIGIFRYRDVTDVNEISLRPYSIFLRRAPTNFIRVDGTSCFNSDKTSNLTSKGELSWSMLCTNTIYVQGRVRICRFTERFIDYQAIISDNFFSIYVTMETKTDKICPAEKCLTTIDPSRTRSPLRRCRALRRS